ncbi:hypothetical protein C121_2 [Stenotrophomonas phage C121]|uniref:hypothetical protein n=1 Tax=Stenotrophomonas phage C121 TaxID=2914029 RepID=UPI0023295C34|nr:hypothetical protein PP752_gp02 [Stenotrophomonas phage C121]UKL14735.1 hypothetical protein C121_2 [Stenotrophomonas phage C121]
MSNKMPQTMQMDSSIRMRILIDSNGNAVIYDCSTSMDVSVGPKSHAFIREKLQEICDYLNAHRLNPSQTNKEKEMSNVIDHGCNIRELKQDVEEFKAGWYFVNEAQQLCGPYDSMQHAVEAEVQYAATL